MPIPPGSDALTWTMAQSGKLNTEASRMRVFLSVWASLTAAQKTALKQEATDVIDAVIVELGDIKTAISGF